jgi:hypothetical protein
MPSSRLLLKWCVLAAVVSAVTVLAYFVVIPLLLPRLWPEVRLLLAILMGTPLLAIALGRNVDSYLPPEGNASGHTGSRTVATAGQPAASNVPAPDLEAERHYQALLLSMARGDTALAERLVDHERAQHPHMTRAQLLQAACESWERDNR